MKTASTIRNLFFTMVHVHQASLISALLPPVCLRPLSLSCVSRSEVFEEKKTNLKGHGSGVYHQHSMRA